VRTFLGKEDDYFLTIQVEDSAAVTRAWIETSRTELKIKADGDVVLSFDTPKGKPKVVTIPLYALAELYILLRTVEKVDSVSYEMDLYELVEEGK